MDIRSQVDAGGNRHPRQEAHIFALRVKLGREFRPGAPKMDAMCRVLCQDQAERRPPGAGADNCEIRHVSIIGEPGA